MLSRVKWCIDATFSSLSFCNELHLAQFRKAFQRVKNKKKFSEEELEIIRQVLTIREELLLSEDKIFSHNNKGTETERPVKEECRLSSLAHEWGLLLFSLIRQFKPAHSLELGTNLGVSGLYQVAAMKLNEKGLFYTFDANSSLLSIAKTNFKKIDGRRVKVTAGMFQNTLPVFLNEFKHQFDFALIDGHHQKGPTINYFRQLTPCLAKNSILVFDDIRWNREMQEAWEEIYNSEVVDYSFDFSKLGICVCKSDRPLPHKKYFKIIFKLISANLPVIRDIGRD